MGDETGYRIGDKRGWISTDAFGATAVDGIFAGGDLVNPVADAISAIADGLRAVEGIVRRAERK